MSSGACELQSLRILELESLFFTLDMFYKNPISLTRKTNHQPQFSLKVIFSNLFPCLPGNKINVLLHKFPRTNSGWRSIYGKRGIKINVTFSEGSPPELCVIVPIDKRGRGCENIFILCISTFTFTHFQSGK